MSTSKENMKLTKALQEKRVLMDEIRKMRSEQARALSEMERDVEQLYGAVHLISKSKPYRIASAVVLVKHAIFGTAEDRKEFKKWLRHENDTSSKYNYLERVHESTDRLYARIRGKNEKDQWKSNLRPISEFSKEFEKLVDDYSGKTVVIIPEFIDWNIPLFQRPQQIAMALGELGVLFVYTTPNMYDRCTSLEALTENCYCIPPEYMKEAVKVSRKKGKDVVIDMYSTDMIHTLSWVKQWVKMGCSILYEYVDDISEEISGSIPATVLERHQAFLKDTSVFIITTADKLYEEVIGVRGSNKNCLNSGNGVDCEHFQCGKDLSSVPDKIVGILEKNKPIVGYFGAIANWFDFELIEYAAQKRSNYEFLMIGPHYGNLDPEVIKRAGEIPNVHFVGTVDYHTLPYVANFFTVATVPFVINEITESTSPIKLFEYMAMGKPVVTTAMRECYKYPVVKVAESKEEYVEYLDWCVAHADDPDWIEKLKETAEQNSWLQKAREIMELIGKAQ